MAIPHPQGPVRVTVPLFDVQVTPLTAKETVDIILERAHAGERLVVGNLNLHAVYLAHTDRDFRRYCESADLVLVDGAPLAMAARLGPRFRVGSTDWLDELMPVARGIRILAIGGTEAAALGAQTRMMREFPHLIWDAVDGYSSHNVSAELREKIDRADVILVGMGMPRQERWLLAHLELFDGKVVANVGGCIDYYAGVQKLAPRWMGAMGIEWVYRLAHDPKRLAYRYLVEPAVLGCHLLKRRVSRETE